MRRTIVQAYAELKSRLESKSRRGTRLEAERDGPRATLDEGGEHTMVGGNQVGSRESVGAGLGGPDGRQ